jgi:hypothetical protein
MPTERVRRIKVVEQGERRGPDEMAEVKKSTDGAEARKDRKENGIFEV